MERFRIISPLGSGGFGEAFRAWDTAAGVPVVLKRPLAKHLGNRSVLERFDREIVRLLDLVHPHIVPIVDHGHDSRGLPYLTMRFLPGGSLADRPQPSPVGHLPRWLPGMAAALDYVHSRGVLHRDVKPANIFFDTRSVPFLGDFGIAKIIDEELAEQEEDTLTNTGGAIGTYPYMAPEFFRKPRVLSAAYDQYALAVTVFEMVAGKRPFTGDAGQLILAHATEKPPDLARLAKGVPESLAAAVSKALAKDPAERFETCEAFAAAALLDVPAPRGPDTHHQFLCPGCHKLVRVPKGFQGRSCKCPYCDDGLRVAANLDALWRRDEDPTTTGSGDGSAGGGSDPGRPPARPPSSSVSAGPVMERVENGARERPRFPLPEGFFPLMLAIGVPLVLGVFVLAGIASVRLIRGRLHANAVARAIDGNQWDAALAREPGNVTALLGRARARLSRSPPDLAGAFVDLEAAEKIVPRSRDVQAAKTAALVIRAIDHAAGDRMTAAESDLTEAKKRGADAAGVTQARDAIARGWAARARSRWEARDGPGVRAACTAALQAEKAVAMELLSDAEWLHEAVVSRPESAIQALPSDVIIGLPREVLAQLPAEALAKLPIEVLAKLPAEVLAKLPAEVLGRLPENVLHQLPAKAFAKLPRNLPWRSLRNSIGMELSLIPAGEFSMGSADGDADEQPVHKVRITKPFYLGVHEVTNAQWKAVMGSVPSRWQTADRPVEQVSWDNAVAFCERLSALPAERAAGRVYRLPTEAEWEYACRAGSKTKYSFGDDEAGLGEHGWFNGNSGEATHPVGQKKPNAWGLYDVHGNVWEWCADWYGEYSAEAVADPLGTARGSNRVFRGGSWDDPAGHCRSAYRYWPAPELRYESLGFRLAMSPAGAEPPEAAVEVTPPREPLVANGVEQAGRRISVKPPEASPSPPAAPDRPARLRNSIGIELVLIPAGEFSMGSADEDDNEKPVHAVRLMKPFYLGVHEVTNAQWQAVMGSVPSRWQEADRPVEQVSWHDAVAFCRKLSQMPAERAAGRVYRLPTEAEWEYACRAGSATRYSFGDDEAGLGEHGWFDGNSGNETHPVGQKKPNAWGLHDMHGNVWEWCYDWYGRYTSTAASDPKGPLNGTAQVLRGGSWDASAGLCRSAFRNKILPGMREEHSGFRVAVTFSDQSQAAANLLDHRANAGRLAAEGGGGADTEAAVDRALKWIANHQMPDGGWSFDHAACPSCMGKCSHPGMGKRDDRGGATAMALLPFLGRGYTHLKGPYKKQVEGGIGFLVGLAVKGNGKAYEGSGSLYSQGLAGIALSECYAMSQDKRLAAPAQAVLDFIMQAQDPQGGGWRYSPRQPGDTSAFGWQVLALKSGNMAYLQVNPTTVSKAIEFLDSVQGQNSDGATYGYTGPGDGPTTSAIGLLCRSYLGWKKDHPGIVNGTKRLARLGPNKDLYYDYYATELMYYMQGEIWVAWNARMKKILLDTQSTKDHETGSWFQEVEGGHGGHAAGRLDCTSLATMILETPYRCLPIDPNPRVSEEAASAAESDPTP